MAHTPDPDADDYSFDLNSNASFDQAIDADVEAEAEGADVSTASSVDVEGGQGQHREYASYSHMVDVAVKSNGQMLALYHNIVEGQPVFAFSEGQVWVGDTKHGVQVRDVKNFDVVKKLGGPIAMRCMTIVDNEVWVGYCNGDIHVYDKLALDKAPREITSSSSKTSIDCISSSNGIIWTGSADWELRARRQSNGAIIRSLPDGHRDWIRSILVVGSNLWSSGDDSFIYLWDAETGEKVRTLELKNKQSIKVKCAVLCAVGSTVWGGCADGYVRIWNHAGDYIKRFKAHRGAVTALVCAGAHVWSGGLDKNVKIWERESIKVVEIMPVTFSVLTMGMHGTQIYLGGRGVVQVRMTSGLLEWLRDTYRKLDEDYVKVLQVYESLLEKYEQIEAEPEKMRAIIAQMQQEKSETESELDSVRKQLTEATSEVDALVKAREALETKLADIEESSEQRLKEMEEEREKLTSHVADHKAKLVDRESQITDHVTRAAEYQTRAEEYEASATQYEKRVAQYEAKVAQCEKKVAEYEALLVEHVASIKDKESQLEQQAKENADLSQQIAALESKNMSLETKASTLQQQLTQATQHTATAKADNDKQGGINAELKEKISKLEKEKQTLQEQEQMLKSVLAVKESKITSDRDAHIALEDQVLRLESDVRERDDNIRVMTAKHEKQISDAKNALSRAAVAVGGGKQPVFVEKCAIAVIFVLCTCLVITTLLFLVVQFTGSWSHTELRPH